MRSICVYCGSADNLHADYLQAAHSLGSILAQRGIRLVYGAGRTGLMGAVADGALQAGGEVIGVIPEIFNTAPLAHGHLSELEVVADMHTRKRRMAELAQAFIALPGGYGTFEELFETLTWAQIGLHAKPVGLLNTRGYFDPLLAMVARAQQEGFIYHEHRGLFVHADEPQDLLEELTNHRRPERLDRWLTRED